MSDQRFLVTARKYRPQRFDEIVAQDHVTGTLKNAVRLDRLAHAYLFTGPRGVGKTTAARILAKAINCTAPLEERVDSAEPCRSCESCRSFEEGRNLNIFEIDAASNNKVDDVRDLRETVRIPPQGARRKVYIVDEVHMLTTQAFNALLKTLEEPPPHVLFIFATTEPHKVLPTIQSRCQRFDFRRIPIPEIMGQLQAISAEEGIEADEGSLMLIARKGDGALRDALSVFDQAVSLSGNRLSHQELVDALGVVGEDYYFRATDHVAGSDPSGMLSLVDDVVRAGYDLQEFLDGLAEHLRNLLVAVTMPGPDLIEAAEATRARYVASAVAQSETGLLRQLTIVDEAIERLRFTRQPRLRLELALLKMASLPRSVDLREALDRMTSGRSEAESTTASPPAPAPASAPLRAKAPSSAKHAPAAKLASIAPLPKAAPKAEPAPIAPPSEPAPKAEPAPIAPPPEPAPTASPSAPAPRAEPTPTASPPKPAPRAEPAPIARPPEPAPMAEPAPTAAPVSPRRPAALPAQEEPHDPGPEAPPTPAPAGPTLFDSSGGSRPRAGLEVEKPQVFSSLGRPALALVSDTGTRPAKEESGAVDVALEGGTIDSQAVSPDWWPALVNHVKDHRLHVGALIQNCQAFVSESGTLVVQVQSDFHLRVLREEMPAISAALEAVSGGQVDRVRIDRAAPDDAPHGADPDVPDPQESLRLLCEEYPALKLLMERFGGEIVW